MIWTSLDTWIVITGVLSALACALPGCFLVLRKMSMMGDAISHAVLPGLALAFLLTHSRDSLPMFIGAAAVGVLTAVFIDWVNRLGRVEESAAMGVVFTSLFALGLILIVRGADQVDLDPGCVLYGALELVPLDTVSIGSWAVPRAVLKLSAVLVMNIVFVTVLFKELMISTFDPALSDTQGISSRRMNLLLMAVVAVTAVAAFESVGSILVIAMLIVPAATAQLATDRLSSMLWVSTLVAVFSAVAGHVGAITLPRLAGFEDTNTAGMIAVFAGLCFGLAVLFAPRKGILSRLAYQMELSLKVLQEDLLGMLYRLEETGIDPDEFHTEKTFEEALSMNAFQRTLTIRMLSRKGLLTRAPKGWYLTDAGRERARTLVRTHRLWEVYLHTHLDTPHVHTTAHRLEHSIDEKQLRQMDKELDYPDTDPHGTPIPRE